MVVTDKIKANAGDLEQHTNWRAKLARLKYVGYGYSKEHEPRCYYTDENGRYYYRAVTEAEMYRRV